jgi:copper(I)-binding protein
MQHAIRRCALALGLLASCLATEAGAVLTINLAWVRMAPDSRSAEAYMQVTSSEAVKLVEVRSFAAKSASLRTSPPRNLLVREIALPAKVDVDLRPGGLHIALDGLTRPLKLGEHVPLTLIFEGPGKVRQEILVGAEVRLRSAIEDEGRPHKH